MASSNTSKSTIPFTEGETALVLAIMKHLTGDIQFDADAIASELGYKDGKVVKMRWSQIKSKKLGGATASPFAGVKRRVATKKTSSKTTDKDDSAGSGEEAGLEITPTKAPKKRGGSAKAKGGKTKHGEMEGVEEADE